MKTAIVGHGREAVGRMLAAHGDFFELVAEGETPELVISYGGDGTLMQAEHAFPGVPKLYLKNSRIGKLAHPSKENEEILAHVASGEYQVEAVMKLEARVGDRVLAGLNDIVLHNANPRHGIRYTVSLDGAPLHGEIIGDGIVFATPLGSTGYYRSITHSTFETGIGLAFNNSTEQFDHTVLDGARTIEACITRGPAEVYADNQAEGIALAEGERVLVRRASQPARLVRV